MGATVWFLAGLCAVVIATVAAPDLERMLPPLVIDTDALRGAVIALGAGLLVMGAVHAIVAIGLGRGGRWPSTVGILLAALLAATLIAIAAAAATSAAATPEYAPMLLAAAVAAAVAALAYGLVLTGLVSQRRAESVN